MNHPLRNFQRGPTWSSNHDPLVARNRIMDDLQFLPGIRMKSIVDRDSGTIGILECCSTTIDKRRERATQCRVFELANTDVRRTEYDRREFAVRLMRVSLSQQRNKWVIGGRGYRG